MNFLMKMIEFVLSLFILFLSIEISDGVSFGMLLSASLVVYLFIKFFISIGGGNKND